MPSLRCSRHIAIVATCALFAGAGAARANQTITQTFNLVPGWNAIYLEVAPPDEAPEAVFQGLPVRSVWTWKRRVTAIEFVADVSEEQLRDTGWLGYFPPTRPEALLSTLGAIQVNRPYLVKLGGSSPVSLSVTGRPSLGRPRWQPSSFNLVGAGLTTSPPTFQNYFSPSKAHAGQPIYRLVPGGSWQLAAATDSMRAGEAFWVFCSGASAYDGPFEVNLPVGDALDFGKARNRVDLVLTNRSLASSNLTVTILGESGGSNVIEREVDSPSIVDWAALPPTTTVQADLGETVRLQLAPRRSAIAGARYEALFEISDGATRRLLPVSVDALGATSNLATNSLATTGDYQAAGLWVGTVKLNEVSEVHAGDRVTPTATPAQLEARLILHVGTDRGVRLYKEAVQMWKDGIGTAPGQYVWVVNPLLLSQFKGVAFRDNSLVGRRISSSFYDFPGTDVFLGDWDTPQIGSSWTLPADFATNPFRHPFHPEHDEASESYAVTRLMQLTFATTDPLADADGDPRPDWQTERVAGTYEETLTGLHRYAIHVRGTFTLYNLQGPVGLP